MAIRLRRETRTPKRTKVAPDAVPLLIVPREPSVPAGQRKTPTTDDLYAKDRADFEDWCKANNLRPGPDALLVARYIDYLSELTITRKDDKGNDIEVPIAYCTVERRAYGVSAAYRNGDETPISKHDEFQNALGRACGKAEARDRIKGLTRIGLRTILLAMPKPEAEADDDAELPSVIRDRALLTLGHAGGLKAGALARMAVRDVVLLDDAVVVTLRNKSKTETITIPADEEELLDHRKALERWLNTAKHEGPTDALWRRITKDERFRRGGLSAQAITRMIQRRGAKAGIDAEELCAGALRTGRVLELAAEGLDAESIARELGYTRAHHLEELVREVNARGADVLNSAATF